MCEKPKDKPEDKPSKEKSAERSYYYDDAHGYEDYEAQEDEPEVPTDESA